MKKELRKTIYYVTFIIIICALILLNCFIFTLHINHKTHKATKGQINKTNVILKKSIYVHDKKFFHNMTYNKNNNTLYLSLNKNKAKLVKYSYLTFLHNITFSREAQVNGRITNNNIQQYKVINKANVINNLIAELHFQQYRIKSLSKNRYLKIKIRNNTSFNNIFKTVYQYNTFSTFKRNQIHQICIIWENNYDKKLFKKNIKISKYHSVINVKLKKNIATLINHHNNNNSMNIRNIAYTDIQNYMISMDKKTNNYSLAIKITNLINRT